MNKQYVDAWLKKNGHDFGRVYKILNVVTGDMYIGSSRNALKKRLYQAISAANSGRKGLLYDNIRIWGKECFDISCLYECTQYDDLKEEEERYIQEHLPSLNVIKEEKYKDSTWMEDVLKKY